MLLIFFQSACHRTKEFHRVHKPWFQVSEKNQISIIFSYCRVPHGKVYIVNLLWQLEICKYILFEGICIFLRLKNLSFINQFSKKQHRFASRKEAPNARLSSLQLLTLPRPLRPHRLPQPWWMKNMAGKRTLQYISNPYRLPGIYYLFFFIKK